MSAVTHNQASARSHVPTGKAGTAGLTGGLAGGAAFGAMMHSMGMMPMIAMMAGSESVGVGWGIHLAISVFIGVTFALIVKTLNLRGAAVFGAGLAYGALWWVLGPLLIMPSALGMPLFMINDMTMQSLGGHVLFGAIVGGVVAAMLPGKRAAE